MLVRYPPRARLKGVLTGVVLIRRHVLTRLKGVLIVDFHFLWRRLARSGLFVNDVIVDLVGVVW